MYVKFHSSTNCDLLAICDEELIGQKFEEGDFFLDVSIEFFKGEKKTVLEVKDLILNFDNLNLVGEKTIEIALEMEIISKEEVSSVKGIPHAIVVSGG
jgi:uncharacterized protein